MKQNKKTLILSLFIIIFMALSVYFYNNSKKITTEESIKNNEIGNVNYKVFLNDNKYYNTNFLDENMSYISTIIDYVDVNFNYLSYYENIKGFKVNKKVEANVKIIDTQNNDKIIYESKDLIKKESLESEKISFVDNYKIDYQKYNDLTNEFKTNYGISAKCTVEVNYNIDYTSLNNKIKGNRIMSLTIPLSEQMINITKSDNVNNNADYIIQATDKPINKILFFISIIFLTMAIIFLVTIITTIIKNEKSISKYDKFLRKILRDYDAYITETSEVNYDSNKNVISVNSFKELLDVRNNIEKAIIYIKMDNNNSKFLIIDDEIYEYNLERKNFE